MVTIAASPVPLQADGQRVAVERHRTAVDVRTANGAGMGLLSRLAAPHPCLPPEGEGAIQALPSAAAHQDAANGQPAPALCRRESKLRKRPPGAQRPSLNLGVRRDESTLFGKYQKGTGADLLATLGQQEAGARNFVALVLDRAMQNLEPLGQGAQAFVQRPQCDTWSHQR